MVSGDSTVIGSAIRQIGFGDNEIRRSAKMSDAALTSIIDGDRAFTDSELNRIERATGKTISLLAASLLEPKGGAFTNMMETWAEFYRAARRRPRAKPSKLPNSRRSRGLAKSV
ncbi:MAG TPA: hypothetical protein VL992_03835 [Tepidisphaeraceae bacterium]|nr:hypothetical protein [Tepidisphaeraceae bacterium]